MATKYQSDAAIAPGLLLQDTLEELGMTQAELARRMNRPPQTINEIIGGQRALTADTAIELEQVLGVPAYFWNDLEADYQLARARHKKLEDSLAEDVSLFSGSIHKFYGQLVKWGVVRAVSTTRDRVMELRDFWQVTALKNVPQVYVARFRTHNVPPNIYAMAAWLRVGEMKAKSVKTKAYDTGKLQTALPKLRKLSLRPLGEILPDVTKILGDAGVVFVPLPCVTGAKTGGATFWFRGRPIVLVSDLGKREDSFWFNLFHEIGHVLLHGNARTYVNLGEADVQFEAEANQFSGHQWIPDEKCEAFLSRLPHPDESQIRAFAEELGIHPGIVAGRLATVEKAVPWDVANSMRQAFSIQEEDQT